MSVKMFIIKKSIHNKYCRGCVKRKHSYTVLGNANWCHHYGKQCGDSFKKLGIELPYDPAIPLLGIHTKDTRI